MSGVCKISPIVINKNNQEVDSKLFDELAEYTGNTGVAQELWALSQIEEIMDKFPEIEYDENGEPTFESFSKVINIKEYSEGKLSLTGMKREAGAINNNNEEITYSNSEIAISKAVNFNKENPSYVASVSTSEDGYNINVEEKTVDNSDVPKKVVFNNALNNKLLGIMRSIGFDVEIDNNSSYAGIFDPTNAMPTADGLRTVIRIAKGELGESAFPEEFSHLMIAGLSAHPLVTRLLNALTEEAVEDIIGSKYDEYKTKYNGDIEMLKKEAAGKLLKEHLNGNKIEPQYKSLIQRLWDWIKSHLLNISESDINDAINEANRAAGELAEFIMSDNVQEAVDYDMVLEEKPLYDLEDSITSIESVLENSLKLMSKKMKILSTRTKSGKYNDKDVKAIRTLKDLIKKKKYADGCVHFLSDTYDQISGLNKELKKLKSIDTRKDTDLSKIRRISYLLRQINEFSSAYADIIKQMKSFPDMVESGDIELSMDDAKEISEIAIKTDAVIDSINNRYRKMRYDVVFSYLSLFWGEDKKIKNEKDYITVTRKDKSGKIVEEKKDTLTLAMIMNMAYKDINGLDRWISSLSDASDPMLSLLSKAVKATRSQRDEKIRKVRDIIRKAHKDLRDAGYSTDFMYERDEKGNLTGMLISDIDYVKFNKERNAFIKSLEEEGLKKYQIQARLDAWEERHMEFVKIPGSLSERTEILPRADLYHKDVLSKLSKPQRDFYDNMIQLKARLEDSIPQKYASIYRAVQIRKDMIDIASQSGDVKKTAKAVLDKTKSRFVRQVDNTDFGEKSVLLDFNNNPVEKIPIYYTTFLEDPGMLSTDFTSSIVTYAGMAINYNEMSQVIDVLELTRDFIKDREVQQLSGDKALVESFKVLHTEFREPFTRKGKDSNIGKRIDDFYASAIYDKKKREEGTIGKKVDTAQTLDSIKAYTGMVGLGLNTFSAITNVTVGKMQIFIEAVGGEYFGYKNSIIGKKNYYKDLPAYLGELNAIQKTNKMALLIDKFDALEEFYEGIREKYTGNMSRIIGKTNLMILNNMGEHYLHTRTMLAMLDRYKVKDGDKEISLYDALVVKEKDGVYSLELKEGVTKLNGEAITEDDFTKLKMRIGKVNQSLNGAFNDFDKGAIQRYALGRMAMQFRQWMPAHYYRRFAKRYYDAELDQYREGFYNTVGKFMLETIKDLKRGKFEVATRFKNLSEHEIANMKRALAEIGIFVALTVLLSMMGPEKDHKGIWWKRFLIYNLKRMKLEVGASAPVTPDFLENIWTILQSPAASIKSFNNISDLLLFWNMFKEIESGRYKGYSVYEKDLIEVMPVYGQFRKLIDIGSEDYMFSVLNKSN